MSVSGEGGHVFVVPGDITKFACEAWLLPTDRTLSIRPHWWQAVPGLDARRAAIRDLADAFASDETLAHEAPGWPEDQPVPVLTAVPFRGSAGYSEDLERRVEAGLATAAAIATQRKRPTAAVPLVALPLFGTGGGGADPARGEVITGILTTARRIARDKRIDVALVLRDRADVELAQRLRRQDPAAWADLDPVLAQTADELAARAGRGQLVPFMGSGISLSAGLPLWSELVSSLRDQVGLDPALAGRFAKLNVLDQAAVLRSSYSGSEPEFRQEIARLTDAPRYGLAPALLAGLPTREAVTLNYDSLYEAASEDQRRPVAVLPQQAVQDGARWLLKLHGTVAEPDSIVLTRDDYLACGRGRAALSALAKAMLMTRHLLFVGFGFQDDHFHELMYEVRQVLPRRETSRRFGTAVVFGDDPLQDVLWGDDLHLVRIPASEGPQQGRALEMFLDRLLASATTTSTFFFDKRYSFALSAEEVRLRDRLVRLVEETPGDERRTDVFRELSDSLAALGLTVTSDGGRDEHDGPSWFAPAVERSLPAV